MQNIDYQCVEFNIVNIISYQLKLVSVCCFSAKQLKDNYAFTIGHHNLDYIYTIYEV